MGKLIGPFIIIVGSLLALKNCLLESDRSTSVSRSHVQATEHSPVESVRVQPPPQ